MCLWSLWLLCARDGMHTVSIRKDGSWCAVPDGLMGYSTAYQAGRRNGVIMSDIKTTYLALADNADGNTDIRVSVYYLKDGNPRGYYLSVTPVRRDEYFESTVLFSGYRTCLVEVKRASKKAVEEALKEAVEMQEIMVSRLLEENNYQLA